MNYSYGPGGYGGGTSQVYGWQPDYGGGQGGSRGVGSGTAVTAGVLGIALGFFCIGRAVVALIVLKGLMAVRDVSNFAVDLENSDGAAQEHVSVDATPYYAEAAVGVSVAALFIVASVMLLNRRVAGRVLMAVLSGLALVAGVVFIVLGFLGQVDPGVWPFVVVPIVAVTLYTALARSTEYWCAAR